MNFGKITRYLFFGGGQLLADLAMELRREVEVIVVTSKRHADEIIIFGDKKIRFKNLFKDAGIRCLISEDVNIDEKVLGYINNSTIGISCGAAWIFKETFINKFNGKLVNMHGTRLPQDRGGGGFSWRILNGDRLGYCVIHQIDSGIDTGNIIKYKEFTYPAYCRIPIEYQNYTILKYKELVREFLLEVKAKKEFEIYSQIEYLSTHWPRLSTEHHGYIDWTWSMEAVERFICAFDDPYKGAATFINNKKVRLKKCYSTTKDGTFHPFQQGIIYRITSDVIFVAMQQGALIIAQVGDEEGCPIKVNVGDRFNTPISYLDEAKKYRAIYTPLGLKEKA